MLETTMSKHRNLSINQAVKELNHQWATVASERKKQFQSIAAKEETIDNKTLMAYTEDDFVN